MKFSLSRAAVQQCLVWLSLCIALFAGASTASFGGIVQPSGEFDHLATGFPLLGRHQLLSCESCHRDGEFKGLPKLCAGCHDGKTARGKHLNHIPTVEQCGACHLPQGFNIGVIMDHSTTTLPCAACHNSVLATGKGPSHLTTSNNCAACHVTSAWVPALRFDHTETTQSCETCHNGVRATGKNPSHPDTGNACGACHRTTSFRPALTVDHREIAKTSPKCADSGCHDGIAHTGKPMPSHAAFLTTACGACHAMHPQQWDPRIANIHPLVINPPAARPCTVCHVLGKTSSLKGLVPTPQPSDHIPTTESCDLCHVTTAWLPATRAPMLREGRETQPKPGASWFTERNGPFSPPRLSAPSATRGAPAPPR